MPKLLFAAALIAALPMIAAGPALAGSTRVAPMKPLPGHVIQAQAIRRAPRAIPPEGYMERIWTHPEGCKYSRTGRPGEIVWFLMRIPKGATCPEFIVQKKIDNAYRAPRIFKG